MSFSQGRWFGGGEERERVSHRLPQPHHTLSVANSGDDVSNIYTSHPSACNMDKQNHSKLVLLSMAFTLDGVADAPSSKCPRVV